MKTIITLFLCFWLLAMCAQGQTAMAFELNVQRVPATVRASTTCQVERVMICLYKNHIGIITRQDTLLLQRVASQATEERRSALCKDLFHFNQLYLITLIQDRISLAIYITPVGQIVKGSELYSLIISSKPICY